MDDRILIYLVVILKYLLKTRIDGSGTMNKVPKENDFLPKLTIAIAIVLNIPGYNFALSILEIGPPP
ncbi:hypothetical protein CWC00_11210 [Pseudoalteromonas rubra]|nr:hypothetical protein CWC00_11210 [Pseudoalteromonas rubra]